MFVSHDYCEAAIEQKLFAIIAVASEILYACISPSLTSVSTKKKEKKTHTHKMYRASLEQHAALLLDLGGLWAEHSANGLIKHCLQTSLSESRALQVFYCICSHTNTGTQIRFVNNTPFLSIFIIGIVCMHTEASLIHSEWDTSHQMSGCIRCAQICHIWACRRTSPCVLPNARSNHSEYKLHFASKSVAWYVVLCNFVHLETMW